MRGGIRRRYYPETGDIAFPGRGKLMVCNMPAIKDALTKMSTAEKLQVMEFLWSALSSHYQVESPAWHDAVLDERANATDDEFEDWEDVKRELRAPAYAH